jgi:PAS domain S-box-containing protein
VFTAANPALQRMLGRSEKEIVGHNALELNPEEERAATADALAKFPGRQKPASNGHIARSIPITLAGITLAVVAQKRWHAALRR